MTAVILFVLGAVVGSFLNVVGLRWDSKNFTGRSKCPHCNIKLKWWELVPILSFLALRAKCSGCKTQISWQYLIIELWTGLIFVTIPLIFIPVFCIYIVITIYDSRYKIIPDSLVYLAILLSLGFRLFVSDFELGIWDLAAGPILFGFFALIWLLSRGRAMGFGDAKLGLSVGLLLGATQGFSAIVLAFWIGALGSLIYIFLHKYGFLKYGKELTMGSEIPFAPFIILGAWVSMVFDLNILHVTF